jgi:hypothetical protein
MTVDELVGWVLTEVRLAQDEDGMSYCPYLMGELSKEESLHVARGFELWTSYLELCFYCLNL